MLVPVDRDEGGRALERGADVLGADHAHDAAPAPDQLRRRQWPTARACLYSSRRLRVSRAGRARLLFDRGCCEGRRRVFSRRHCRYTAIGRASLRKARLRYNADAIRPLLRARRRFRLSAGATNLWRGCASISRATATSTGFRARAAASTTMSSIIRTTSSTCCCRITATTPRARAWIGSRSCSATAS